MFLRTQLFELCLLCLACFCGYDLRFVVLFLFAVFVQLCVFICCVFVCIQCFARLCFVSRFGYSVLCAVVHFCGVLCFEKIQCFFCVFCARSAYQ